MDVNICTIAARNYLPFVRTLADSFADLHPDGRLTVLLIDDEAGEERGDGTFDVLRLSDLSLDRREVHRMAMIYDVTEFATALKPWLLEHLLDGEAETVLYLDPDIRIYGSLVPLVEAAHRHGIALTPHCDVALPLDGKKTDDRTILGSGIYNLGFIGVGASARPFLAYWQERLRRQCLMVPEQMRFVDQRWIDFVPGLFDHVVLRDPQYNVAYWNLHGRTVRRVDGGYEVDGRPLVFFHFSGFSPSRPHLLSKHQGENPRILLSEHPEVAELCAAYGAELTANGADAGHRPPYGFDRMANGTPIDEAVRIVYRRWVERAEDPDRPGRILPPDPFDPVEAGAVVARLNAVPEDDEGGGTLSAYLSAEWALHADLRAAFPDPNGADRGRFLAWARNEVPTGRFPAALVADPVSAEGGAESSARTVAELAGRWAPPDRLRPGIVVAGYLNAELGIGEGARLTARAVEGSGIPFTTVGYRATHSRQDHPFPVAGAGGGLDYDMNIVVVNADMIHHFAAAAGSGFFAGRYTVGQWAWELETFPPEYAAAFGAVHEIWAVSEFARQAIAAATDKPVLAVPHPIPEPSVRAHVGRASMGLPEGFMFLFCFDLFSVLERKNPIGTIDAFCRAFAPGEGPTLVLKVINGNRRAADLEHLRWAIGDRPDIILLDRYLDHDENAALMAMADCYVSLHRSEGFGLTMAEAMALAKPVIATAYSGNLDFMDPHTAYLVPAGMVPVPPGSDPYPAGSRWADPDLDEAARLMRRVVAHPDAAREVGERARRSVLTRHGLDEFSSFVRRRFGEIQAVREAQVLAGTQSADPTLPVDPLRRRLDAVRRRMSGSRSVPPVAPVVESEGDRTAAPVAPGPETVLRPPPTTAARGDGRGSGGVGGPDVQRLAELEARVVAGEHGVSRLRRRVEAVEEHVDDAIREPEGYDTVRSTVAALRAVPDMGDGSPFVFEDDDGREVIGYRAGSRRTDGYAGFEDVFRGSEDVIRKRLEAYLPLLEGRGPIVDVGSGRGEMLDLLAEHGIAAEGIDLDATMVARSRAKGHAVQEGDAVALLGERPAGSLGAVVTFQVIEHLGVEDLVALLDEVHRVLAPGGLLIAETVNPHSVQAFKAFWTDLTHRLPIFPEVLTCYCQEAGYASARVLFPGGTGRLENDRWRCGDYAVMATKAE